MHAAELRLRCSLLGIPWTRALVTSVQPWWAGAFCTGCPPTAGNLEPSRVSAHLFRPALLTWWPTSAKPRRYAEWWTRCWTLLLAGSARCCFHHWHLLELNEFPGGTASWSRRPDLGIEIGLCSITGAARPSDLGKFNWPRTDSFSKRSIYTPRNRPKLLKKRVSF